MIIIPDYSDSPLLIENNSSEFCFHVGKGDHLTFGLDYYWYNSADQCSPSEAAVSLCSLNVMYPRGNEALILELTSSDLFKNGSCHGEYSASVRDKFYATEIGYHELNFHLLGINFVFDKLQIVGTPSVKIWNKRKLVFSENYKSPFGIGVRKMRDVLGFSSG